VVVSPLLSVREWWFRNSSNDNSNDNSNNKFHRRRVGTIIAIRGGGARRSV
jgi:hypothetical protein